MTEASASVCLLVAMADVCSSEVYRYCSAESCKNRLVRTARKIIIRYYDDSTTACSAKQKYCPFSDYQSFARFNRPFPSSHVPLFQSESKCETILMKMTLICMKMKLHVHAELIFIWKVSHLDSFWNRGTRELGYGLFSKVEQPCSQGLSHLPRGQ